MTTSWELPPLPTAGDAREDLTHLGIGRIADTWEAVEFELCLTMSQIMGDPLGESMRLYGDKRTFPNRLADFSAAATNHFIASPDQHREGALQTLLKEAEMASKRRNDVIHNIVLPINQIEYFRLHLLRKGDKPLQYGAVPPYHNMRSHDQFGLPNYAYTLATMSSLRQKLQGLLWRIREYRTALP